MHKGGTLWSLLLLSPVGSGSLLALRLGIGASESRYGRNRAAVANDDHDNGRGGGLRWIPLETDTDPVCGKVVDPARAKPSVYDGYVYYRSEEHTSELQSLMRIAK